MSPEMSLWFKTLGAMGAGFFILNFWAKWLRKKRSAPRWAQRVPHLVLGLVLVSTAVGAYCQWKVMSEVPQMPPQAAKKFATYWNEYTTRTVKIGLASISAGGVGMLLATLFSMVRKAPVMPGKGSAREKTPETTPPEEDK